MEAIDSQSVAATLDQMKLVQNLYRAKLDFDMVYWGVEQVDVLAAADVAVPPNCDLRPGAYRWDAKAARFEPLAPSQVKKAEGAPTLEQAFAELAAHIAAGQAALPPRVQAWLDNYNQTVDVLGAK